MVFFANSRPALCLTSLTPAQEIETKELRAIGQRATDAPQNSLNGEGMVSNDCQQARRNKLILVTDTDAKQRRLIHGADSANSHRQGEHSATARRRRFQTTAWESSRQKKVFTSSGMGVDDYSGLGSTPEVTAEGCSEVVEPKRDSSGPNRQRRKLGAAWTSREQSSWEQQTNVIRLAVRVSRSRNASTNWEPSRYLQA